MISGGADSMVGAYHWVERNKKKIVFSHIRHNNTPRIEMIRNYIIKDLKMPLIEIEGRFTKNAHFREISGSEKQEKMNINQSRTLFYLCHAIPVNFAFGIKKIFITENGPFTLNPYFTESHTFTSTTNPDFIASFNNFIFKYFNQDNENAITIKLPFREYTKAELMASIPNNVLNRTHSCSKSSYSRDSCLNCFACYIRKFSSYAYKNFDDDLYNPDYYKSYPEIYERYSVEEKNNYFNKDITKFSHNDEANLIIELIQFCYYILQYEEGNTSNEIIESRRKFERRYGYLLRRWRKISGFYSDIWKLLKRFSFDILSGIHTFFEQNHDYENVNYYIYDFFSKKINKLIDKEIIPDNYSEITCQRIKTRGIRGDIRE